jgi:PAS domain S-box-containing protein
MPTDGLRGLLDTRRKNIRLFALLALLGVAASYFAVTIPNTSVSIDGRGIVALVGFAHLRRWWQALLLAVFLSIAGPHTLPLHLAALGNMLFMAVTLLVTRICHSRLLERAPNLVSYGIGWLIFVLLLYQGVITPVIWGYLAYLEGEPILLQVVAGWRLQPFLEESLLVGIITALAMSTIRGHRQLLASREELSTTLYAIGDGVITTDATGRVRRLNPEAERLTGWFEAEARGRPMGEVFQIVNEETRAEVENPVTRVLREGTVVGLANHTVLMSRDGEEHPIADSGAPIRQYDGTVIGVVLVIRDQSGERTVQRALEEGRDRLELALKSATMGIWEWEISTGKVTWDGEHHVLFGIPLNAFKGTIDAVQECVHPEDRERGMEVLRRTVELDLPFDNTYRVVRPDGAIRWLHSYGTLYRDGAGGPQRIVGTTQDITERVDRERALRNAIEEKDTLLRELYHRTKNSMHLIRSVLMLKAGENPTSDVQRVVQETERRIHTIAMVHDKLYQRGDLSHIRMSEYLPELVDLLLSSHDGETRNISIDLDVQDVELLIDTAIPCGLVITELMTNALNHAFPGKNAGTITLRLRRASEGHIELLFCDDGVGVSPDCDLRELQTMGIRTIVSLVEHQLQGHVSFETTGGLCARVTCRDDLYGARV